MHVHVSSSVPTAARQLAGAVLLACLLFWGHPAGAAGSGKALPPQGLYENCDIGANERECLDRLGEMRAAGFEVVLNYWAWSGTLEQVRRYAERAHQLGLKLIWPFCARYWWAGSDPGEALPQLARAAGSALLPWAVSVVRDLPATWGYYVGDEAKSHEHEPLLGMSDQVAQADPAHPRLYVAFDHPNLGGSRLQPFADVAEVLAADYYPVGTDWPIAGTAAVARNTQRIADQARRQSAMVLQAYNWGDDDPSYSPATNPRWPTTQEMRHMRNLALLHSRPNLILWFDYYFIKPPRTTDTSRLEALRKAAFAPPPIRISRFRVPRKSPGHITWHQTAAGRITLTISWNAGSTSIRLPGRAGRNRLALYDRRLLRRMRKPRRYELQLEAHSPETSFSEWRSVKVT